MPNGLYLTQPYQPGRIPVVFVHGTASKRPLWWAEMFNTLGPTRCCGESTSSGTSSTRATSRSPCRRPTYGTFWPRKSPHLDPEGKDPALQQMVVVGHSQGGLLA